MNNQTKQNNKSNKKQNKKKNSSKQNSIPIIENNHFNTEEELERRRKRFAASTQQKPSTIHYDPSKPIIGRCMTLEKSYFRLTGPPDLEQIRPEPVLKKAYKRLKNMWKEGTSLSYLLDQLKAIRQDLVVQNISDKLTVKVYELNARIAIHANDMNELNQCQTMLQTLYKMIPSKHQLDFLSYNLIYDIIHNNIIDIHRHVQFAQAHLTNRSIQHSLLVLDAIRTKNYPYYLQLLETASVESRLLMEIYLPTFQHYYIKSILVSAFPSISIDVLAQLVHITAEELKKELANHGIVVDDKIEISKYKLQIANY